MYYQNNFPDFVRYDSWEGPNQKYGDTTPPENLFGNFLELFGRFLDPLEVQLLIIKASRRFFKNKLTFEAKLSPNKLKCLKIEKIRFSPEYSRDREISTNDKYEK